MAVAAVALAGLLAGGCGHAARRGSAATTATATAATATTAAVTTTAVTTTPATTTVTTTGGTPPPRSASAACTNAIVTASVRAALVVADGRPGAMERPGQTFYGRCGHTHYAVASFQPGPRATEQQSVAFQDHGSYPEFLKRSAAGSWTVVGSAPGPPGARNCSTFALAPAALRRLWADCVVSS